jgi:hypothetical protein
MIPTASSSCTTEWAAKAGASTASRDWPDVREWLLPGSRLFPTYYHGGARQLSSLPVIARVSPGPQRTRFSCKWLKGYCHGAKTAQSALSRQIRDLEDGLRSPELIGWNLQRDVRAGFSYLPARRCNFKGAHSVRASLGQWSHLDDAAVFETGALLGDGDGFGFIRHLKMEITANRFLRLRKRTVDHDVTTLAGNKLAHVLQWMTAFALALLNETLKPNHPCGRDFLNLCIGELFEPGIPAE